MYKYLEDLQNTRKQYFVCEYCVMLQNHAWLKYPFEMQGIPMDFNITAYETFINTGYRFQTSSNRSETTLIGCGCDVKEKCPQLSEKAIKVLLCYARVDSFQRLKNNI